MASDEKCSVCDRVKERGGCEVEVTFHSKRRYGDDNLRARRDCDQHSVDWRSRALAAEAQRDSLESAIAQAKQAADFDRISFGAMRARIAELESALAAVTEGKDRWRKAATGLGAKWSSHVKRIAELERAVERMRVELARMRPVALASVAYLANLRDDRSTEEEDGTSCLAWEKAVDAYRAEWRTK